MRFQLIILFPVIIVIECINLTPEENLKRLESCGKLGLKMDYQDGKNLTFSEKDGLVKVETKNVTEPYPTMGFFISNRHILTSAHSVLTKNLEWRFGGNPWDKDSKFPQDVPNDVRDRLSVQLGEGCGNDCVKMIKSAKLIGREPENDFDGVSAMLLIELNDNQTNVNFPCLSDEKVPIIVGETVDTYGFNNTGADWELFHNTTTVKEQKKKEQWICVTSYYTLDARGGPLLKNVSGKATVIGLTANTEINITVNYVYFLIWGHIRKSYVTHLEFVQRKKKQQLYQTP